MIVNMWNNLCILLVANNIKCRIVDGFGQGIGYSGYSFACSGCIFLREFRNSRTVDFRYDERVSGAKWEYIEKCNDVVVLISSISVRRTVNDLTESTSSVFLPNLWDI